MTNESIYSEKDIEAYITLYEKLAKNRVIPYYAIRGIMAPGIRHFAMSGKKVRSIIKHMENKTSGFCIPHLITLNQKNNKERSLG